MGFCCDQPKKGCQELPQIDFRPFCALGKRQAHTTLARLCGERNNTAAQSHGHVAQRADGAEQREGVGHRPLVGLIRKARARQRRSKNPGVRTKGRRSTASTSHAWSRIERAQSRTPNLDAAVWTAVRASTTNCHELQKRSTVSWANISKWWTSSS